eukprot:15203411-Alexandrium_andersonii.AAC.1
MSTYQTMRRLPPMVRAGMLAQARALGLLRAQSGRCVRVGAGAAFGLGSYVSAGGGLKAGPV